VRLGGTTHCWYIAGLRCASPCLALLHGSGLGLLLPFEQQRDHSVGVVLLLGERLLREVVFDIDQYE
jgi:hypothetical protein